MNKLTKIRELTQEEILYTVKIWAERCNGCQNMKCENDWKDALKCRGYNRINRTRQDNSYRRKK